MRSEEPGKNVPTACQAPSAKRLSLAKRALACCKPRCRTYEQVNDIADLLTRQEIFQGVERDDLLAVAYFIEAKHSEAGECILSKGQPLEQWCLLLDGNVLVTRYSSQPGAEQSTLGPDDSWSETALLHSSHPRRSRMTVVAGQYGCITLQLRYTDFDAINDPRNSLQLLPPEGTTGPVAVPEITPQQRRAAFLALLCCCLRRLAASRGPNVRTPEEASELEPFLSSLPAYRSYPSELTACLAAACRTLCLPAGSIVYEHSTLADAQVTVLSGEVQMRRFGGGTPPPEEGGTDEVGGGGPSSTMSGGSAAGGSAIASLSVTPSPPPGSAGHKAQEGGEGSGSRLSIRARLRREREARKLMQRQLDEYVARLESAEALSAAGAPGDSLRDVKDLGASGSSGAGSADWTRVFMQKAMRTAEPVWKALHPADNMRRRRQATGDGAFDNPFDEGPITEVAQLLGPAAAKAYYRGLQSQGYSDTESPDHNGRRMRPSEASGGAGAGGSGTGTGAGAGEPSSVRERWRRWMFSVEGPETEHERTLRNMAMSASRIIREQHARSRRSNFDAEELEETYGPLVGTLTRGSPVGELSTVTLHSSMRKESALAGPRGCELLLVDWEAYQQAVLAARSGLLLRAAPFLAALPKERLTQLAEMCLCLCVDVGTLLARQGGVLESLVVVQSGELQLLHEPNTASHTRITTVKGHAVSRSRNGRTHTMPLLATLSQTHVPGSSAPASAGISGPGPLGPSAPGPPAASAPPAPGPSSFTEVTLQGLPLGKVGVGGVLGEGVLGLHKGGGKAAVGQNQSQSQNQNPAQGEAHPHPSGVVTSGAAPTAGMGAAPPLATPPGEGPKWPATVLAARSSVLLVVPRSALYTAEFDFMRGQLMRYAAERRAWLSRRIEAAYREAAAPLTTPAVFANGGAAAGGGGGAGGGSAAAAVGSGSGSPASPQLQQPLPSLRRSVLSSAAGAGTHGGSEGGAGDVPRRAVSGDLTGANDAGGGGGGGGGGPFGAPPSRRRSIEVLPRSTNSAVAVAVSASLAAAQSTAAASNPAAVHSGNAAGGPVRVSNKWDFLDGPTAAPAGAAAEQSSTLVGGLPPAALSTGSFTRTLGASPGMLLLPPSLLEGGGSFTAGAGAGASSSLAGGLPLRRPSSGSLWALKEAAALATQPNGPARAGSGGLAPLDAASLTPVQLALLDAGLDPGLGAEASLGEVGGGRRGSVLASPGGGGSVLPALAPPLSASGRSGATPSRVSPGGGGGGVSPSGSVDFDAVRAPGAAPPPLRSPNGLSPLVRRASGGLPPTNASPAHLLDQGFISTVSSAPPLTPGAAAAAVTAATALAGVAPVPIPSSANIRASYSGGGGGGVVRRAELEAVVPVPGSPRVSAVTSLPLQSTGLSPSRVPGLAAVDLMESIVAAPGSPGLYSRNSRASYTGGMGGRRASTDCLWLPSGDAARRGGLSVAPRGPPGRVSSVGDAEAAEFEEAAALARSLVPKNQAGNFMVREGLSSTPAKQPAVRRIANCF